MRSLVVQLLIAAAFVGSTTTFVNTSSAEVAAQDHQPGRFAAKNEVLGGWKRIPLPADLAGKFNEYWPAQVQYFQFDQRDRLNSVMISNDKDPELNAAALAKLLEPLDGVNYRFDQDGMLTVTYKDQPGLEEHWGVNIFIEDHKSARLGNIEFKKGDIMMTLDASSFDKNKGGVVYIRHLRKVE